MKPDLLMIRQMQASVMEQVEDAFTLHRLWEAEDRAAFLAETGPRIRGIATGHGVTREVIEACPNLEIVSSFGVGYDNVDVAACKAQNVRVTNTPDVLSDGVAEMTLGLMLALARRIPQADTYVRRGDWVAKGNYPLTAELTGKTVGILGLGRIGKEIATRCQAMKMQVLYCGRTRQADQPYPYFSDVAEMAKAADWLVGVVPGSPSTNGLVSRQVLEALGPEGCLVNVGRGSLVEESAMIEMLESGALGGAALDVFEDEPNVPERLRKLENVVLSPHQASATHKTRRAMGDLVVANLRAHFAGDPLISPVA